MCCEPLDLILLVAINGVILLPRKIALCELTLSSFLRIPFEMPSQNSL